MKRLFIALTAFMAVFGLFAATASAQAVAGHWGSVSGDTLTACTLSGPMGSTSMCGLVGPDGFSELAYPYVNGGFAPVPVSGSTQSLSMYFAASHSNRIGAFVLDFFDSTGHLMAAQAIGGQYWALPANTWVHVQGTAPVPPGASTYLVIVYFFSGSGQQPSGQIPQGESFAIQPLQ